MNLRSGLLLLWLSLSALGAPPEPVREVEVSFYCLEFAPGVKTVHLRRDDGYEAVELSTANLSEPVALRIGEGNRAVVYRAPAAAETAASVVVPPQIRKALVILIPAGPGKDEPYQALVLPHGLEAFPLGTYRLVNFSPYAVRGAIGKSQVETKPGGVGSLSLEGEPGSVQPLRFEFQQNGAWNRLTESRAAVRKDRRWLLCIYQDPRTKRVNLRSIPDRERKNAGAADAVE